MRQHGPWGLVRGPGGQQHSPYNLGQHVKPAHKGNPSVACMSCAPVSCLTVSCIKNLVLTYLVLHRRQSTTCS